MILLAVLALATVAPPLTGANAQTANEKLASGNLVTASERRRHLIRRKTFSFSATLWALELLSLILLSPRLPARLQPAGHLIRTAC